MQQALALPIATCPAAGPRGGEPPIVIGHRGASAYRPEHTLASYELAIEQGADHIEPDLVPTKDGVLVARHENELSRTTDVEQRPEFVSRRATKDVDGSVMTGWFTEDFTLAELKTLRATERFPQLRPDNTAFDGLHEIPTFQEVIDLARRHDVGICAEIKHETYFEGVGLPLEEPLLATLERNDLLGPDAPVLVQSFETTALRQLRRRTGDLRLVQLIAGAGQPFDLEAAGDPRTYDGLVTPSGLREIARYADGIGPNKERVLPRDAGGRLSEPTALVSDAHRVGLRVHPYTFRPENAFLPADLRRGDPDCPAYPRAWGDASAELHLFFRLGIDGLSADDPQAAVAVRRGLYEAVR